MSSIYEKLRFREVRHLDQDLTKKEGLSQEPKICLLPDSGPVNITLPQHSKTDELRTVKFPRLLKIGN